MDTSPLSKRELYTEVQRLRREIAKLNQVLRIIYQNQDTLQHDMHLLSLRISNLEPDLDLSISESFSCETP